MVYVWRKEILLSFYHGGLGDHIQGPQTWLQVPLPPQPPLLSTPLKNGTLSVFISSGCCNKSLESYILWFSSLKSNMASVNKKSKRGYFWNTRGQPVTLLSPATSICLHSLAGYNPRNPVLNHLRHQRKGRKLGNSVCAEKALSRKPGCPFCI